MIQMLHHVKNGLSRKANCNSNCNSNTNITQLDSFNNIFGSSEIIVFDPIAYITVKHCHEFGIDINKHDEMSYDFSQEFPISELICDCRNDTTKPNTAVVKCSNVL